MKKQESFLDYSVCHLRNKEEKTIMAKTSMKVKQAKNLSFQLRAILVAEFAVDHMLT